MKAIPCIILCLVLFSCDSVCEEAQRQPSVEARREKRVGGRCFDSCDNEVPNLNALTK